MIRNFEAFVTEQTGKHVVSRDETGVAMVSAPYPTYECDNHHDRAAQPAAVAVGDTVALLA